MSSSELHRVNMLNYQRAPSTLFFVCQSRADLQYWALSLSPAIQPCGERKLQNHRWGRRKPRRWGGEEWNLVCVLLTAVLVRNASRLSVSLLWKPAVGLQLGTEIQTRLRETLDSALTSVRVLDNGMTPRWPCFSAYTWLEWHVHRLDFWNSNSSGDVIGFIVL